MTPSSIEYLNQNAYRSYPIQEDQTRYPSDPAGNLLTEAQLPNYVLVDFCMALPGDASLEPLAGPDAEGDDPSQTGPG